MLNLSNLTKVYAKSTVKAVDAINLTVKDGEIFGFLGPNGAGKSTTIKMITGILNPTEGDILLDNLSIRTNSYIYKSHIGYVPDNHSVYEKLTGTEYLNFMGTMYNVPVNDRQTRATELLKKFNLTDNVNQQISTYSHGMKQKIVVIGALLHNPKLWILDEPMTGLDPQSAYELKQLMRQHADKGNIVFFSSHVLEVVEKVCDRVAIINKGHIVDIGTLNELKSATDKTLEQVFLSVTGGETK